MEFLSFFFASFLCINVLFISSAGWCLMLVRDINGSLGKRLPVQPLQSKMWKNTGQIWIIAICECKTV